MSSASASASALPLPLSTTMAGHRLRCRAVDHPALTRPPARPLHEDHRPSLGVTSRDEHHALKSYLFHAWCARQLGHPAKLCSRSLEDTSAPAGGSSL